MLPEHVPMVEVDLDLAPQDRWRGLAVHAAGVRTLVGEYTRDLARAGLTDADVLELGPSRLGPEFMDELRGVSAATGVDLASLVLVNAYYEVFKALMGCSAFAVPTANGPLHARNLDWHSEGRSLSRFTVRVRFVRAGQTITECVSWPGFIGTLSGVAPGRFAVTLNAALSDDPPVPARPVALLLRELLHEADYASAVAALEHMPLGCDALFLVTGIEDDAMCVVERTPTRAALRRASSGVLVATNDYRALEVQAGVVGASALAETTCRRFDRLMERVGAAPPVDDVACFAVLDDPDVKMAITVQQMVLSPALGRLTVRGVD